MHFFSKVQYLLYPNLEKFPIILKDTHTHLVFFGQKRAFWGRRGEGGFREKFRGRRGERWFREKVIFI